MRKLLVLTAAAAFVSAPALAAPKQQPKPVAPISSMLNKPAKPGIATGAKTAPSAGMMKPMAPRMSGGGLVGAGAGN
jgi:hypothetical protein